HLNRSSVLTFKLPTPAAADQTWQATIEPQGAAEILRQPAVLAGYDIGYLQVRPTREGQCTLRIGNATLKLHVAPALQSTLNQETDRPQLVTPSRGAAVWGTFAV